MIVGIEVGGTFTDLVMADGDGRLTVHKLPSTPADPSVAAVDGLQQLLALSGHDANGIAELLHGSTIAANALIQRRGAATVLLTTKVSGMSCSSSVRTSRRSTTCSTVSRSHF